MRRFLAGTMLFIVFLLGPLGLKETAYAESLTGTTTEITTENLDIEEDDITDEDGVAEESEVSDDEEDEATEEAEVLGAKRKEASDKFIICIEVAIGLIFAVGLFAAGKGGYEN